MTVRIINADVMDGLAQLEDESVHCVVTSPPYFGLRDYGHAKQIGLEPTPDAYVSKLVEVFREVRRVLRKDGTCWLNLGDSYNAYNGGAGPSSALSRGAQTTQRPQLETGYGLKCKGLKPKDLIGIPWSVAFALRADGWWLRQDVIWSKPNPMPESVTDRCTKAHEYIFLLTKAEIYFYDAGAVAEISTGREKFGNWTGKVNGNDGRNDGGRQDHALTETRNKRSVWEVTTQPFPEAHFATFPPALIEPCIKAGCPEQVCAKCGAPWVREFESSGNGGWTAQYQIENEEHAIFAGGASAPVSRGKRVSGADNPAIKTLIGVNPSCSCNSLCAVGTVLDPFAGSGTTGLVADRLKRNAILIELNPQYAEMAERRIAGDCPMFAEVVL